MEYTSRAMSWPPTTPGRSISPDEPRVRRTIVPTADGAAVEVIDQTRLPHQMVMVRLQTLEQAATAIENMVVRGAPLIGVTAAYGLWLGLRSGGSEAAASDVALAGMRARLLATRPTAVNLRWALDQMIAAITPVPPEQRAAAARRRADELAAEDVAICAAIGQHGLPILRAAFQAGGEQRPVEVLTHCNAGFLAAIEWGTALAPIYRAHADGIPVHVWVDETRPRNQGASLTAWELGQAGIPHTVIADNAGGHLMQRGRVDLCLVGSDRTTARGDVCNKIGTYLKALAARAHAVPFYVGLPGPTIDFDLDDGLADIPIEERQGVELRRSRGWLVGRPGAEQAGLATVELLPESTPVHNPAFDVTPAALVTGLITERGVCAATREALAALYPERARGAG
jgi:methylthioribose-1-phosphate isomerase